MSAFVRLGTILVPEKSIRVVDCSRMEAELTLEVEFEGQLGMCQKHILRDAEAVDLVMRLCPAWFEGRKFRWVKNAWAFHNLVGHPGIQILSWLGRVGLGMRLHDGTVPVPRGRK